MLGSWPETPSSSVFGLSILCVFGSYPLRDGFLHSLGKAVISFFLQGKTVYWSRCCPFIKFLLPYEWNGQTRASFKIAIVKSSLLPMALPSCDKDQVSCVDDCCGWFGSLPCCVMMSTDLRSLYDFLSLQSSRARVFCSLLSSWLWWPCQFWVMFGFLLQCAPLLKFAKWNCWTFFCWWWLCLIKREWKGGEGLFNASLHYSHAENEWDAFWFQ